MFVNELQSIEFSNKNTILLTPYMASFPDFNNTELAFQAKNNGQLRTTYWLFRLIDVPLLANVGPKIMDWAFSVHLPISGIVKKTLFQQFCGGTSIADTVQTSRQLFKYGVRTILDYSVEGEKNEQGFDATCAEIIATLVHGKKTEEVAFTACKLTGLARFDLLAKVQANVQLSPAEVMEFERVRERIQKICAAAVANQTPIFIDAEESWIQNTIDALAEEMMETHNREKPWIYTTVQLYRHDRLKYLTELIRRSERTGYVLGVKLVRGAYMEKEAAHAAEIGYPNPIQPDKASTDRDYDAAALLCLEHIAHVATCLGSHNEQSALKMCHAMQEKGIAPDHPHILFAQLYGMSDHISFNLAHHGYQVAKYLPYGPVKAVMPYLMRRAQENTSIAGQSGRELMLVQQEVRRRKKS